MTEQLKAKPKRGRPAKPMENKVDLQFHLVLLDEEMELFKAAAEAQGLPSTAIFIRAAIEQAGITPSDTSKYIPRGLSPAPEDKTSKHYPLLLSETSREIIDREDAHSHSEFIRTAALNKVFKDKVKSKAIDEAMEALRLLKGVSLKLK